MPSPTLTPAIDGWFATDPPRLLGQRCPSCGTSVFPPNATTCPNPACRGDHLEGIELGSTGTVWSWATNHYQPPAPYIAAEPFEPYTVVAVEIDGAGLTILGQLHADDDPSTLQVGTPVEVVIGTVLSEGDEPDRSMFEFRIAGGAA